MRIPELHGWLGLHPTHRPAPRAAPIPRPPHHIAPGVVGFRHARTSGLPCRPVSRRVPRRACPGAWSCRALAVGHPGPPARRGG